MLTETVDDIIQKIQQLRLKETQLFSQLKAARQTEVDISISELNVGDRIRITNRNHSPSVRTGTVTRITPDRIYLTTDNGVNTWRLAKNVTKLHCP